MFVLEYRTPWGVGAFNFALRCDIYRPGTVRDVLHLPA